MEQNNETTVPQEREPVQTTITVPFDLWLAAKNEAAEQRMKLHELYTRALRLYFEQKAA